MVPVRSGASVHVGGGRCGKKRAECFVFLRSGWTTVSRAGCTVRRSMVCGVSGVAWRRGGARELPEVRRDRGAVGVPDLRHARAGRVAIRCELRGVWSALPAPERERTGVRAGALCVRSTAVAERARRERWDHATGVCELRGGWSVSFYDPAPRRRGHAWELKGDLEAVCTRCGTRARVKLVLGRAGLRAVVMRHGLEKCSGREWWPSWRGKAPPAPWEVKKAKA